MEPDLNAIFGVDSDTNKTIATMAQMMLVSMDLSTLSHVVGHIEAKLLDPSERG